MSYLVKYVNQGSTTFEEVNTEKELKTKLQDLSDDSSNKGIQAFELSEFEWAVDVVLKPKKGKK